MFWKILLAFVISICLAGSFVYFGMPVQNGNNSGATQSGGLSQPKNFLENMRSKLPSFNSAQNANNQASIATVQPVEPEIYTDKQAIIAQLMEQALQIKAKNLKDQAFLDIVNYATQYGNFDAAKLAMVSIEQKELRDTARGNIAIFMARSGMASEAFDVIDDVEIETLRDVMRLQVIEAIALPHQMPPTIQQ